MPPGISDDTNHHLYTSVIGVVVAALESHPIGPIDG